MALKNCFGGGGVDINGIINQYIVAKGTNVNAGDFVSYVNGFVSGEESQFIVYSNNTPPFAVALDESRVLLIYAYSYTSYSLRCSVCTIQNATVTLGPISTLAGDAYTLDTIKAILIGPDKVFITHGKSSAEVEDQLWGIICSIDGTSITHGVDTLINPQAWSARYCCIQYLISENVIAVATCYSMPVKYYICSVSGVEISIGSEQALFDTGDGVTLSFFSQVNIDTNKILLAFESSSQTFNYLHGILITVENQTLTAGTPVKLSSVQNSGRYVSATLLKTNTVFLGYQGDTSNHLFGMLLTVSGDTLTVARTLQISTMADSSMYAHAIALSEETVLIAHGVDTSNYYLCIALCSISGTTITKISDVQISSVIYGGMHNAFTSYAGGSVVAFYGRSNYMYVRLMGYLVGLCKATGIFKNYLSGVAASSAGSEEAVDVYVPE